MGPGSAGYAPAMAQEPEPPASADGEDFASAALVALVAASLRERAPELLPDDLGKLDPVRQARSPLAIKRALLERAYQELGPGFVFEIGPSIRIFESNPLLEAFLRSPDGAVLLAKWARFERYGHGLHRTRIENPEPGLYRLEHYATRGPAPGAAHDLFVLGILTALLERVEPRGLSVSLLPGPRPLLHDGTRLETRETSFEAGTSRWELRFPGISRGARARDSELEEAAGPSGLVERLRARLADDPSRSWSLAEVARALGVSARSLQRRLGDAGTSFTEIVRSVRVGSACRLIETTRYSMTEIGYLCGFTDAAQFSRDFRASVGASPSQFREVVAPDS